MTVLGEVVGARPYAGAASVNLAARRTRVALTVASLAPEHGGPSRSVPSLRDALVSAGAEVELFTVGASAGLCGGVTHLVRAHGVQLIHDNGVWLPSNHAAAAAARALAIPFVTSPRGMLEPWSLRHRAWKKRAAWWAYQRRDLERAAMIHATSDMEMDNLRRLGLRNPIAVVPNGVDVPELLDRSDARPDRTALFLSRVHPKKGLLNLVRAWGIARPAGWRLVIAGPDEGGHTAEVAAAAEAAGVAARVMFVGAVEGEAKRRALQGADLFVLPTFSENFGIVVAEALANGVPVITTTGAPWSGLTAERCGWWIDVGVGPLVDALRTATALSDAERAAMGARGREWVGRAFAWVGVGRDMLAAYRWLLDGGDAPACVARV